MSATRSFQRAPEHPATADFNRSGYHAFQDSVDPDDTAILLAAPRQTRTFDSNLFLSEAEFDAPLFLLGDSHKLGGTLFPHALTRNADGWLYGDRNGQTIQARQTMLTGAAGYAAVWRARTLHGTQPDAADNERLSLRYLFAKAPGGEGAGIDAVNAQLSGPISLSDTRRDLDATGAAVIGANSVNRA